MTRRMSCSMTVPAVRARTKTVTRRHVDTWKNLKPGDRLTLIEKGMEGVEREGVSSISAADPDDAPSPNLFAHWWAAGHGYGKLGKLTPVHLRAILCRRIEWRYLNQGEEQ